MFQSRSRGDAECEEVMVMSLGPRALTAKLLTGMGVRMFAGPFDWVRCNARMAAHAIDSHFAAFLDEDLCSVLSYAGDEPRATHAVYADMVRHPVVFQGRTPLTDRNYYVRAVARALAALADRGPALKKFVLISSDPDDDAYIDALFAALCTEPCADPVEGNGGLELAVIRILEKAPDKFGPNLLDYDRRDAEPRNKPQKHKQKKTPRSTRTRVTEEPAVGDDGDDGDHTIIDSGDDDEPSVLVAPPESPRAALRVTELRCRGIVKVLGGVAVGLTDPADRAAFEKAVLGPHLGAKGVRPRMAPDPLVGPLRPSQTLDEQLQHVFFDANPERPS